MKKSKRWIMLGFGFIACLGTGVVKAETVDKVVAVVNDDPITLYQLDRMMAENLDIIKNIASQSGKNEKFKDYKKVALQRLIDEKLLQQELVKKKISVTDEDMERGLKNVLERNKMTEPELKKELAAKGESWGQYQMDMKEQLKRIKFMGQVIAPRVRVTDEDLDEFFAQHPEQFGRFQSVEMAQIILPLKPDATDAQIAAANKLAAEIIKKAKDGANFKELGKKYSMNSQTAVKDVYQVQQLAPQIGEIIAGLKANDVSEPVRSNLGLHIIKLYERKTMAGDEYKALREQIREKVFEKKVDDELGEYLENIKEQSFIEIKS